jgi:hypothetical protein
MCTLVETATVYPLYAVLIILGSDTIIDNFYTWSLIISSYNSGGFLRLYLGTGLNQDFYFLDSCVYCGHPKLVASVYLLLVCYDLVPCIRHLFLTVSDLVFLSSTLVAEFFNNCQESVYFCCNRIRWFCSYFYCGRVCFETT